MKGYSYDDNEYQINENISENYLKVLKEDQRTTDMLKDYFKFKGDELVDMSNSQNKKVLIHSSKVYESLMDQYESFNDKLMDLDTALENMVNSQKNKIKSLLEANKRNSNIRHKNSNERNKQRPSASNNNIGLSDMAIKEFDKKIDELKKLIAICEDKIILETKSMTDNEQKAKEVIDYTNKFKLEKRIYLDKVEEEKLRDMTYHHNFSNHYQVILMKMIFESLFLEKVQFDINERKKEINIDSSDEAAYNSRLNAITQEETFKFFKKNCYNAWKFKNQILGCEDFVIHEYQKEGNTLPSLESIIRKLNDLKNEAEKIHDSVAKKVFWPLINAVIVIVYITIGKQKSDMYNNLINKSKINIFNYEAEKNDNHGKIVMLEEIKERLLKNSNSSPMTKNLNMDDSLNDNYNYNDVDIDIDKNNNKAKEIYNIIEQDLNNFSEETSNITEYLKNIKEQQEEKFYGFIKDVSSVLMHQKNLKNQSNNNYNSSNNNYIKDMV